jgi:hypothetical protein
MGYKKGIYTNMAESIRLIEEEHLQRNSRNYSLRMSSSIKPYDDELLTNFLQQG